jgi:hypothetical protein
MIGNARKQRLRVQPFAFFVCVNGIDAVTHPSTPSSRFSYNHHARVLATSAIGPMQPTGFVGPSVSF